MENRGQGLVFCSLFPFIEERLDFEEVRRLLSLAGLKDTKLFVWCFCLLFEGVSVAIKS